MNKPLIMWNVDPTDFSTYQNPGINQKGQIFQSSGSTPLCNRCIERRMEGLDGSKGSDR